MHKEEYIVTHIGLIIVGVKGLTRSHLGAHVVLVIFDDKLENQEQKVICMMDVDMTENRGLFYCAPNLLLASRDSHQIKIGIMSKGYGNVQGKNLVITTGILGKATKTTSTKYICKVNDIIEGLASKGVRFLKPEPFSAQTYANIEWPIGKFFSDKKSVLTPEEGNIRLDMKGFASARFFGHQNQKPIEETSSFNSEGNWSPPRENNWFIDETTSLLGKNIDLVDFSEAYSSYTFKRLVQEYDNISKYLSGGMEEYMKKIEFFLGKSQEQQKLWIDQAKRNNRPIELIRLFEENIRESEKIETDSIISRNLVEYTKEEEEIDEFLNSDFSRLGLELMNNTPLNPEPVSFARPSSSNYSQGNLPPRQVTTSRWQPKEIVPYYKPIRKKVGKEYPLGLYEDQVILQIEKYSSQIWTEVIQQWKSTVIRHYLEKGFSHTAQEMYSYLETTLGNSAKRVWDDFKSNFPDKYTQLIEMGNNPYNFLNTIGNLLTKEDPNMGSIRQQEEAIINLEQIKLNDNKLSGSTPHVSPTGCRPIDEPNDVSIEHSTHPILA